MFERKVFRNIYGAHFDTQTSQTNEWRLPKEIKKRKPVWAGYAWRMQESLIRNVIEENSVGRRSLGKPRLRWEYCAEKDVETVDLNNHWRELAENRDT